MARENNAMSLAEIATFLQTVEWVAPGLVDGEQLFFAAPVGSAVEAALKRDARCCCSADVFPSYYDIKGATVHGAARPAPEQPEAAAALDRRAAAHGLAAGAVYALPLAADAFGFDFAKLERR
jgi:hypothetical protein